MHISYPVTAVGMNVPRKLARGATATHNGLLQKQSNPTRTKYVSTMQKTNRRDVAMNPCHCARSCSCELSANLAIYAKFWT
jgi:hypothetical protein